MFDKENGSKGVFVNILQAQNVFKKGFFALRADGKTVFPAHIWHPACYSYTHIAS